MHDSNPTHTMRATALMAAILILMAVAPPSDCGIGATAAYANCPSCPPPPPTREELQAEIVNLQTQVDRLAGKVQVLTATVQFQQTEIKAIPIAPREFDTWVGQADIPSGAPSPIATLGLPTGDYLVTAHGQMWTAAPLGIWHCQLVVIPGSTVIASTLMHAADVQYRGFYGDTSSTPLTLEGIAHIQGGADVTLECDGSGGFLDSGFHEGGQAWVNDVTFIAVQVTHTQ